MRKAQSEWLKLMPKKLLLSIMLTPITDRFIMSLFNVQRPTSSDDLYAAQEVGANGLTKAQRLESVEQLIGFFKFCMVVLLYVYSAYQKWFRENNNNFEDSDKGLTKIIDSMMRKIK